MSKHGWTYKKLGDVCNIEYGTRVVKKKDEGKLYPVYGGGGATFKMDKYNRENRVVISRFAMSPKCTRKVNGKFFLNDSGLTLRSSDLSLKQSYLDCCVLSLNDKIYLLGRGVAQKNLKVDDLVKLIIPVPGMAEQEAIVAELDEINEAIAALQQQVADLDTLAQSTFYDMFGDPVTNPKAWPVIQLGDKCEVTSFKRVLIEDVVESGIPFIRGTELGALSKLAKGQSIEFSLFITSEHYEKVKAISGVPKIGDLLIPSINSDGNIWILDTNAPMYFKDGRVLWIHVNHDTYTSESLKYIVSYLIRNTYSQMASGATFAELKLFILRELKTILPPLALQQAFAEKVEAIESAKAELNAQIAEMQTLLASRMDYYFD